MHAKWREHIIEIGLCRLQHASLGLQSLGVACIFCNSVLFDGKFCMQMVC